MLDDLSDLRLRRVAKHKSAVRVAHLHGPQPLEHDFKTASGIRDLIDQAAKAESTKAHRVHPHCELTLKRNGKLWS